MLACPDVEKNRELKRQSFTVPALTLQMSGLEVGLQPSAVFVHLLTKCPDKFYELLFSHIHKVWLRLEVDVRGDRTMFFDLVIDCTALQKVCNGTQRRCVKLEKLEKLGTKKRDELVELGTGFLSLVQFWLPIESEILSPLLLSDIIAASQSGVQTRTRRTRAAGSAPGSCAESDMKVG